MIEVIHMIEIPSEHGGEPAGAVYVVSGDRVDSGCQIGIFPHTSPDRGVAHALSFSLNTHDQDSREPRNHFFTSFDPDKSRLSR